MTMVALGLFSMCLSRSSSERVTGVLFAMMRDRTCYFNAALPEPSIEVA